MGEQYRSLPTLASLARDSGIPTCQTNPTRIFERRGATGTGGNSVWLNHLRFLGEELRQKLNQELPSLEIKELRFRQGTLDKVQSGPPPTGSHAASSSERDAEPRQPLSQEQQRLLDTISDPELRRDLETLLTKQRQRSHK